MMICITFDTDWIRNDYLTDLDIIEKVPGKTTFFCTQRYEYLENRVDKVEIALHPRLEWNSDWPEEVLRMKESIPYCSNGLRPHSCSYSHMLGIYLAKQGFKYISQATYLYKTGMKPFMHPWGIWEMPIYYMDNMDITFTENWGDIHDPLNSEVISKAIYKEGIYVFDFHPVHLMLNSPDRRYYEKYKLDIGNGLNKGKRFEGRGTYDFFMELVTEMKSQGIKSHSMTEALEKIISDS